MKQKKQTMLVVDDEMAMLQVARDLFETRGWHVITTPTGRAGLDILKNEKVNIILLDICLPGETGMRILKTIKKDYPGIPVVIITALGHEDKLVNEALQKGASGYVSKGTPLRELVETVHNALSR